MQTKIVLDLALELQYPGTEAGVVKLVHRPYVYPLCRDSLSCSMGVRQCVVLSYKTGVFEHIVHSVVMLLGYSRHNAEMNSG